VNNAQHVFDKKLPIDLQHPVHGYVHPTLATTMILKLVIPQFYNLQNISGYYANTIMIVDFI
jgi:hypothetical protein